MCPGYQWLGKYLGQYNVTIRIVSLKYSRDNFIFIFNSSLEKWWIHFTYIHTKKDEPSNQHLVFT